MSLFNFDSPLAKSSPLSDFVRNTSSGERKKIYAKAIEHSIVSQNKVIKKAEQSA